MGQYERNPIVFGLSSEVVAWSLRIESRRGDSKNELILNSEER